jgi:hypothetical protein
MLEPYRSTESRCAGTNMAAHIARVSHALSHDQISAQLSFSMASLYCKGLCARM